MVAVAVTFGVGVVVGVVALTGGCCVPEVVGVVVGVVALTGGCWVTEVVGVVGVVIALTGGCCVREGVGVEAATGVGDEVVELPVAVMAAVKSAPEGAGMP